MQILDGAPAFDRLRHQATLQIAKRDTGVDYVETLPLESGAVTSSAEHLTCWTGGGDPRDRVAAPIPVRIEFLSHHYPELTTRRCG
jgi:hypothetical protein